MNQEKKAQMEDLQNGTGSIDEAVLENTKPQEPRKEISPILSDPWYVWFNTGRDPRGYSGGGGYEGGSRH